MATDTSKRLQSLDAFRGFDMMFIIGIASLIYAICALFPGGSDCWLAQQMDHAEWAGLRHHDTIFPTFLFIAGISFPFSYAKQVANGYTRARIYRKIFTRGIVLVLLGLVYNGLFDFNFASFRYFSVLARIGLAWMFAALIYINFGTRTRGVMAAGILVGYYLLLRFVTAPDFPGLSPWSEEGNIAGYIDRTLASGHIYLNGLTDPEGFLSTIPAIATAMLGMFTGEFVRVPEEKVSGGRKTLYMLAAAAVMLGIGLLWSLDFPCIKKLWTSTFVLIVGAYSLAVFALFYWVIDVKGWNRWAPFFTVVGMNSITIYMAQRIISFRSISRFFLGGVADLCPEPWARVIITAGYFAASWLFLYFLYKKKIFLKV